MAVAVAALAAAPTLSMATAAYADDVDDAQMVVDDATAARDEALSRIEQLEAQIDEANAGIPAAREQLRRSVVATYKHQEEMGEFGVMGALLGCESFDEMVSVANADRSIQDMRQRSVANLLEQQEKLSASKAGLDEELAAAEMTLEQANEGLAQRKAEAEERERVAEEARSRSVSAAATVSSGTPAYENSGSGLTKWGGVYYYNGHRETYYSSRVLRHYRIGEWHTDDEGFWRTAEGYYVVAANSAEYCEGTLVDTSKGLAQVLDCGCSYGTIDMYVNW